MRAEDFIFTPLSDPGGRLERLYGEGWRRKPLGVNVVERDLRRYADFAGLEKRRVTPTTLRYTAARLKMEAGATEDEVGEMLGFCERCVTRAFLKRMGWGKGVENLKGCKAKPFGLEEEKFRRNRRGAQRRNQNALRYGFYARYLEPDGEEWRIAWEAGSPNYAIALLRIRLGRLFGYAGTVDDPMRMARLYDLFRRGAMRVVKTMLAMWESQGLAVRPKRLDREFEKAMRRKRNWDR